MGCWGEVLGVAADGAVYGRWTAAEGGECQRCAERVLYADCEGIGAGYGRYEDECAGDGNTGEFV